MFGWFRKRKERKHDARVSGYLRRAKAICDEQKGFGGPEEQAAVARMLQREDGK